jgi:hypothetical protein
MNANPAFLFEELEILTAGEDEGEPEVQGLFELGHTGFFSNV